MRTVLISTMLLWTFAARAGEPAVYADSDVAVVTHVEGKASRTPVPAQASAPESLEEGDALVKGDLVSTEPGARLEFELPGGSVVRVGEKTQFTLREAHFEAGKKEAWSFSLALGNFWAKVSGLLGDAKFEVETEDAVAGVRGTEFHVEVTAGDEDRMLRVYEGDVEVRGREGGWTRRVGPLAEFRFRRAVARELVRFSREDGDRHPFMAWCRARHKVWDSLGPAKRMLLRREMFQRRHERRQERREDRREDRQERRQDRRERRR
jgi:hypothetical protein